MVQLDKPNVSVSSASECMKKEGLISCDESVDYENFYVPVVGGGVGGGDTDGEGA